MELVMRVAGSSHFSEELQLEAFAPGAALRIVCEPDNPFDPNAVAIWDAAMRHQVGYVVPRDAPDIADCLESGLDTSVIVVAEHRNDRGRRDALDIRILTAD